MLGNMLNDLAEAIRRWTEKKAEPAGHLERAVYHSFRAGMDDPTRIP